MSKGISATQKRSKNVEAIYLSIKKSAEDGIIKNKLIAKLSIDWGNTPAKIKEYVDMLLDSGYIFEKEGILYDAECKLSEGEA